MRLKLAFGCAALSALAATAAPARANTIDINFNSGVDMFANAQGILYFTGQDGFQVYFTDDESSGGVGGNADGVHITNTNHGNIKVNHPTDFVLGAYNTFIGGGNYHSSGIVAVFNQGATLVSFDDTDNDSTPKSLFAYDQFGTLIAQSAPASQVPVIVHAPVGQLIYRVEFDTQAGILGGSNDGTVFTIDNFHAEGVDPDTEVDIDFPVPEPTSVAISVIGAAAIGLRRFRRG